MSRAEKRAMIDPSHKHLSVVQQCGLLGLGRSSFYYQPVQVNAVDLVLMAAIDRQFLETPYYGSRRMVAVLRRAGYVVNRKRVRRLMRQTTRLYCSKLTGLSRFLMLSPISGQERTGS